MGCQKRQGATVSGTIYSSTSSHSITAMDRGLRNEEALQTEIRQTGTG